MANKSSSSVTLTNLLNYHTVENKKQKGAIAAVGPETLFCQGTWCFVLLWSWWWHAGVGCEGSAAGLQETELVCVEEIRLSADTLGNKWACHCAQTLISKPSVLVWVCVNLCLQSSICRLKLFSKMHFFPQDLCLVAAIAHTWENISKHFGESWTLVNIK